MSLTPPAAPWRFSAPASPEELEQLLRDDENAILIAGGQSLLPRLRVTRPAAGHLIDVMRIAALRRIETSDAAARIGAAATYTELVESKISRVCPAIGDALAFVGTHTIRNRATVGGSLAWADPRAELPLLLLALGATIRTTRRDIAIDNFLHGPNATALSPGEAVLEVAVAAPKGDVRFEEVMARNSAGRAIALAAVETDSGRYRITAGGLVDRPVRSDWLDAPGIDPWLDGVVAAHPDLADPFYSHAYRRTLVRALIDRARGADT